MERKVVTQAKLLALGVGGGRDIRGLWSGDLFL